MKNSLRILIVVFVGVGIVIGGIKIINSKKAEEAKSQPAKRYSIVVETFAPKLDKTTLTLPFLATTKSNDNVKISSKVPSRIKYIVNTGMVVKKGDVIVKLDDEDFKTKLSAINLNIQSLESQIDSKNIALKNLKNTHKRTEELIDVRGASKEQYDKEVTNIEALKAGIQTLKYKIEELKANKKSINNMLSYATITAPVSGVATNMANIGDVTMPGKPLISISSNTNSYLLIRLPQDVMATSLIYKNKKVNLIPLNTTFNGLLEYLANIDESLATDQRVEVDIILFEGTGFKLPIDTVLNRKGKSYVLDIKNGKATPKEIQIIAEGEQGVVVNNVSEKDALAVAKPDILLKLLSGISVKGL